MSVRLPRAALAAGAACLALVLAAPAGASAAVSTAVSTAVSGAAVQESAEARFAALAEAFDAFMREQDVITAGRRGDLDAAARWPAASPEATAARLEAYRGFGEALDGVDPAALAGSQRASWAVMRHLVDAELRLAPFEPQRIPFTNDSGFFSLPGFVAATIRPRTSAEAEAWIARLETLPDFFEDHRAWLQRGVETGFTQNREIVEGVIARVEAAAASPPETSPLMQPFDALPAALPEAERARLRAAGLEAVREHALPAYAALAAYLRETYLPAARAEAGVAALPEGRAYYAALARSFTTLDLTPDAIHRIGLDEVARIRAEMEAVIARTGFEGDFAAFLEYLRTDPRFYAETEAELLRYAAYLSKKADDVMPSLFSALPRLPYGVRKVPDDIAPGYTTARYWPGDLQAGIAGGYMVNTHALDQRPLYEMPALTLHEAVPGHHHQIALAQELEGVPEFRRRAGITAFIEGWALYAERLGLEMGFYEDPYDDFGRLTYEMWRACRLVVDTGLHHFGWTREEAAACLLENSALAPMNVESEISRYMSWPGQALAYKPGELLIRELRAEAEAAHGQGFDVRAFHDALLKDGSVPLDHLETEMRAWIAAFPDAP